MALRLSSAETRQLAASLRTLVTPAEHPSTEAWGNAAMQQLLELFDADKGAIISLPPSPQVIASLNEEASVSQRYVEYYRTVDTGMARVRQRGWSTWHLSRAYTREELLHSEFGCDFVRAIGVGSAAGLRCMDPDGGEVMLTLTSARREPQGLGERAASILGALVLPAFRAGLESSLRLEDRRGSVGRLLDLIEEAVLAFSVRGRRIHTNRSAARLLEDEPEAELLHASAASVAASVLALALPDRRGESPSPESHRDVRTSTHRYRVQGTFVAASSLGVDGALVTIRRMSPRPLDDQTLRRWHGLTDREVEVAKLLAMGKSNSEIARELFVSEPTARTHTQRILLKLGVRSRSEVARVVLGG